MNKLDQFVKEWGFFIDALYVGSAPLKINHHIRKDIWRITLWRGNQMLELMFTKSMAKRDKHGRPQRPTPYEVLDWLSLDFLALEDTAISLKEDQMAEVKLRKDKFIQAFGQTCYEKLILDTWEGAR